MTQHDPKAGPTIMWFRNDLRLADNPALHEARETGQPLLCVFVLEEDNGLRQLGAASRWWLHHSLAALRADLETAGARLDIVSGEAGSIIPALVEAAGAGALMFNRRYGRSAAKLDERIDTAVSGLGCEVASFNGRLLHEPWEIKTKAGGSYGVYTPFWKASLAMEDPGPPLPRHHKFEGAPYPSHGPRRVALDDLHLLPSKPNWSEGWDKTWTPGEAGAAARLRDFLKSDLADYADERNKLASRGTSRLSPHLRFGEISPRTILAEVRKAETKASTRGAEVFLAEIGWREFDYHVLHHHPDVADENLHRQFDRMPWEKLSKAELDAWKKGRTGYPVVDAGMRELWATGYMHNRVRMITASFLIKHLLCDWRIGERWFWDTLCDADPANNTMNWQWVAGSGADAAPFFRIFNPVTQGEKFDPEGDYVRRWVPELAKLNGKTIHAPWTLTPMELAAADIELGKNYPRPMIDHKQARQRALDAYETVKGR
jgi:deoxyribodipyrimidine photo-lyase